MTVFRVNGMSCGHCTNTITKAILALDPAATIETDIPSQTVKVASKENTELLSQAIIDAGYEVIGIDA